VVRDANRTSKRSSCGLSSEFSWLFAYQKPLITVVSPCRAAVDTMEVAIPTSISTSTTQVINPDIQPQICSHSHCGRPVGYGFPKNALCCQCMTMSYRPFPNTKHGSNGDINHTDPSKRPGFSDVHWDTTMNDRRAVMVCICANVTRRDLMNFYFSSRVNRWKTIHPVFCFY